MKRYDLLLQLVVQERKVLLLQAGDWLPGLIRHYHIERHAVILLGQSGEKRKAEYTDPSAASRAHATHLLVIRVILVRLLTL
jgi:hypothetical protein